MTYTWNQYQDALKIVKTFEKERDDIRYFRSLNKKSWDRTIDQIVWEKRIELNNDDYGFRNLSKIKREKYFSDEFINTYLCELKNKLLELHYRAMRNKIKK